MNEYYFGKGEIKHKGGKAMIIMDIKIDNFFAFKNFHMNMSYPKKIVDSTIEGEYLQERPNFRYKKVNIIMGSNATGKTSLGRILMYFANYMKDGEIARFFSRVNNNERSADLSIDFVDKENRLYRFKLHMPPKEGEAYKEERINSQITFTEIGKRENYEQCKERLDLELGKVVGFGEIDTSGWSFSYPQDVAKNKEYHAIENDQRYRYILEKILKVLDPSIKEVIKIKEVDNTYGIKLENQTIIIQNGKIVDTDMLSSGTKAGLDISYIIASLICDKHDLYYCDELFSYVNSDIEKASLSLLISRLTDRKQLFFTTHNTDILDMQLPKHSFTFLKKEVDDLEMPIKCINAGQYLKRNTDSLKHAVENGLFCTSPDLNELYEIANF